jgi:hypothetical protein
MRQIANQFDQCVPLGDRDLHRDVSLYCRRHIRMSPWTQKMPRIHWSMKEFRKMRGTLLALPAKQPSRPATLRNALMPLYWLNRLKNTATWPCDALPPLHGFTGSTTQLRFVHIMLRDSLTQIP